MKKKNLGVIGISLFLIFALFSLAFPQEQLTITTYYPSPYGVYKTLRIYPSPAADCTSGAACSNEGEMCYNNTDHALYICSGSPSTWQSSGGGGGYWTLSGTDLYANDTNWNVGIGTDTPNNTLQVKDLINFDKDKSSTFLGYQAGYSVTSSASWNTAVGYQALRNHTIGNLNTAIGHQALYNANGSTGTTAVGSAALASLTTGSGNTAVGNAALMDTQTGFQNTAMGYGTLMHNTGGGNTVIGYIGLMDNTGSNNTGIGSYVGNQNLSGSNNVFIGYMAGYNETGSNKLYIDNSSTTTPLIYGDFVANRIGINYNTPTRTLHVGGDIAMTAGAGGTKMIYDIAEDIPAAEDVGPADVVVIDANANQRVVKSTRPYDATVAGVISTSPAFLIDMKDSDTPLALAGRAPCKVTIENGPIKRGDLLVTSSKPGYAMKADSDKLKPGMIVGKALESLDEKEGKIIVLLTH